MKSLPLKGKRVVNMSINAAVPTAARCLADWGAEVIWLEPYKGGSTRYATGGVAVPTSYENGMTTMLELLHANEKSMAVDFRNPEGLEMVKKLIGSADVFLSSYRNNALKDMGLDYDTLHEKYPGLVYAHLTGYGEKGPLKDAPGYDITCFWAMTGLGMSFSNDGEAPFIPMGIADYIVGSMLAGGICAALVEQEKTGKGDFVSTSLYGAGVYTASQYLQAAQYNAIKWPQSRKNTMPSMNLYKCADGGYIQTAWNNNRMVESALKCLGLEEYVGNPLFASMESMAKNQKEIIEILDPCFLKHTSDEWAKIFEEADVASMKLGTFEDVLESEQAKANYYIYKMYDRTSGDEIWQASTPVQIGSDYKPIHESTPLLGEDTADLLRDLGYDEAYIQEAFEKKVCRDVFPADHAGKFAPRTDRFHE